MLAGRERVLTKSIYCNALECPKKALYYVLAEQEIREARSAAKLQYVKNQIDTNLEHDRMKLFNSGVAQYLDIPLHLQNPAVVERLSGGGGDGEKSAADLMSSLRGYQVHDFARSWHRYRFYKQQQQKQQEKEQLESNDNNNKNSQQEQLPIEAPHLLGRYNFEERVERTSQLIKSYITDCSPHRRAPLGLHEASFSIKFRHDVELRISCDLLEYTPPPLSSSSSSSSKKDGDGDDDDDDGFWTLREVKSGVTEKSVRSDLVKSDVGFQKFVLSQVLAQPLTQFGVLHPSRTHMRTPTSVQTKNPRILCQFFAFEDLTDSASSFLQNDFVEKEATRISNLLWPSSSSSLLLSTAKASPFLDSDKKSKNKKDKESKKIKNDKKKTNENNTQAVSLKEEWFDHFENSSSTSCETKVMDQESICGSHCTSGLGGNKCRFYNNCVPSETSLPGNVFGFPGLRLKSKTKLWNSGIKFAHDPELLSITTKKAKEKEIHFIDWEKDGARFSPSVSSSSSSSASSKAKTKASPLDIKCLSESQLRFAVASKYKKPVVHRSAIRDFISKIKYPLVALDFEAAQFALPPFSKLSIYEQVPFQFSAHIVHRENDLFDPDYENGFLQKIEHREFLHLFNKSASSSSSSSNKTTDDNNNCLSGSSELVGDDPRLPMARALTSMFRELRSQDRFQGSILCHFSAFEYTVMQRLHNILVESNGGGWSRENKDKHSKRKKKRTRLGGAPTFLNPAEFTFLDTLDLVRKGVTFSEAAGSSSLKKVLPLLAESAKSKSAFDSSKGHFVTDGNAAAAIYWMLTTGYQLKLFGGFKQSERRDEQQILLVQDLIREEMLRYCAADSLGTLELVRGCAKFL